MIWDEDSSSYVFGNSGRTFYVNRGLLSVDDGPGSALYGGYDHTVWLGSAPPFTPAERLEIAGEMIRRWTAWAAGA